MDLTVWRHFMKDPRVTFYERIMRERVGELGWWSLGHRAEAAPERERSWLWDPGLGFFIGKGMGAQ